jgi:hypothetical protein
VSFSLSLPPGTLRDTQSVGRCVCVCVCVRSVCLLRSGICVLVSGKERESCKHNLLHGVFGILGNLVPNVITPCMQCQRALTSNALCLLPSVCCALVVL